MNFLTIIKLDIYLIIINVVSQLFKAQSGLKDSIVSQACSRNGSIISLGHTLPWTGDPYEDIIYILLEEPYRS